MLKNIYICDNREILMYKVNFHETGLVPETGKVVLKDFECGGINADKFGNLFFVNKDSQNI